jgi:hypothetical protein
MPVEPVSTYIHQAGHLMSVARTSGVRAFFSDLQLDGGVPRLVAIGEMVGDRRPIDFESLLKVVSELRHIFPQSRPQTCQALA